MKKEDVIVTTNKKEGQSTSENDCDASCEKGKHDASSLATQHAREIPPLESQQIDKGDNILNPMADKLEGIKKSKQIHKKIT